MINERNRKSIAREHSRRLSAGDVDALLELYAKDATFEDPVGAGGRAGHEALRAHFESAVAGNVAETVEDTVVGQDGAHVLSRITAVMDYRPRGPVYADRGWLPAPQAAEPTGLRCHYALLLRVGESGLIEDMRAFWGRPDIETSADGAAESFRGPESITPDEAALRQLPYTYARRLESGDVSGTVALFSDDVVFEDPVGRMKLCGKEALAKHVAHGSAGKVNEILGRPVSSMDGRFVVIRGDARIFVPEKMRMRMITVCELNKDGLGVHIQGFWGITDTTFGDMGPDTDTDTDR
ncbi:MULTISPECIES: nuclear transport factor 2 family protein [Streptomyces]|uniref:Nuclear transport factor 2 family protein n=1 Tax=Streptomyces lonegramiae TaxID=3075524 RepID=A0ABU2XGY9_9ACTN|nr:nuclear transport factor 2 family protein [Streptomyces sp. DSM 41529]MDT0544770.1 nuclear transport factor 2 family protein [Streptomyces sp. DSM 41529]